MANHVQTDDRRRCRVIARRLQGEDRQKAWAAKAVLDEALRSRILAEERGGDAFAGTDWDSAREALAVLRAYGADVGIGLPEPADEGAFHQWLVFSYGAREFFTQMLRIRQKQK